MEKEENRVDIFSEEREHQVADGPHHPHPSDNDMVGNTNNDDHAEVVRISY